MRHFISKSLIMAELQPQREVEPQLLNGGDFNEEREDADASESVKKKRRKKKRKTSTAGNGASPCGRGIVEEIVSSCATQFGARASNMRGRRRLFNLSEGIRVQLEAAACWG